MVNFELNGADVTVEAPATMTLLDMLRVELGVKSVKKGCEQGECGACTVLIDGYPMTSCIILAPQVEGRHVCTVEGLVDSPLMKELREAFMENGAVQCGFCTPGMLSERICATQREQAPHRGGGQDGNRGEYLPMHGVRRYSRGDSRRG